MSTNLPEQLVERFLRSIKNQFYKGHEKLFYQERNLLMQAICWPARYLNDRAVSFNAPRYTAILTEIIRTINAHGNIAAIRSPSRYLLHAVQEHMRHHGETYYEAAKATRNALEDILHGLQPRVKGAAIQNVDSTVPALAEAHRILIATKPGKRGPRKPAAPVMQDDLFTPAKRLQPPRAIQSVFDPNIKKSSQTNENTGFSCKKFPNRPPSIQKVVNP